MTPPKTITIDLEVLVNDQSTAGSRSRNVLRTFNIEDIMYIEPSDKKNRACLYTKTDIFTTYDNYKTLLNKLCELGHTQVEDRRITVVPCIFCLIGKKHIVQGASIQTVELDAKGLHKLILKRDEWQSEIVLHTKEEQEDARRAWTAASVAVCLSRRDVFYQYGLAMQQRFQQCDATQTQLDTMVEQIEQLTKENEELKEKMRILEEQNRKNE